MLKTYLRCRANRNAVEDPWSLDGVVGVFRAGCKQGAGLNIRYEEWDSGLILRLPRPQMSSSRWGPRPVCYSSAANGVGGAVIGLF